MTLICLRLQPRADAITERQHSAEVGSYIYFNMHLLELLEYCQAYDKLGF